MTCHDVVLFSKFLSSVTPSKKKDCVQAPAGCLFYATSNNEGYYMSTEIVKLHCFCFLESYSWRPVISESLVWRRCCVYYNLFLVLYCINFWTFAVLFYNNYFNRRVLIFLVERYRRPLAEQVPLKSLPDKWEPPSGACLHGEYSLTVISKFLVVRASVQMGH